MPCYVCEKCGCIDNTALGGNFWTYTRSSFLAAKGHGEHKTGSEKRKDYIPALCCECYTGKWHDQFEKLHITDNEYYASHVDELLNPDMAKRFIEDKKER